AAKAEPAAPPPARPDPPYVAAAKNRKKVPYWAAPVLALLVPWAYLYYNSVQPPPAGANDPMVIGADVYSGNCQGCHGPTGGGGTGPKLAGGEVLKTFKDPLAMAHWIAFGAVEGARPNGTYGDKDRPGGAHNTATFSAAMPPWKDSLTPEQIAAVTMYVREDLSGAKPEDKTEKGFTPDVFDTLADKITKVIALGPGGDPDLKKVAAGS
ncbi:MAG: hypothetical protein JWM05_2216, partial [Acidimicrobiales bacterium]|nr:hypothetical protein [Acidimicrobiales bacterium]